MVNYLTFPDAGSGTLQLIIAFTPGAGSVTVIVVKSWNLQAFIALQ